FFWDSFFRRLKPTATDASLHLGGGRPTILCAYLPLGACPTPTPGFAPPTSGFEKRHSSIFGFTTTLSMVIFSAGTGGSLNPSAVLTTGRTFVSRTYGI